MRSLRITVAIAVIALGQVACGAPSPAVDASNTLDPAQALSRQAAPGFERITEPRPLSFPTDYGPHPETQTEWWYLTGNLETEEGRTFGYQFTIFRLGIKPPEMVTDSSEWTAGNLYMAHVALSDLDGSRFVARQRLVRPVLGLAGAEAAPFRTWLEGWTLASADPDEFFPLDLLADFESSDGREQVRLALTLGEGKPLVLQGDQGYSRKGAEAADASMYYSFTRIPTGGDITIGDVRFSVTGLSWLDREWSTSVLSRSQRGWDWFALQLADGREIMLFELRSDDPATAVRDGTLVDRDGSTTRLALGPDALRVVDTWTSPIDGARYPSAWRLSIPAHEIDLEITSAMGNQEHTEIFRYWEGAVQVSYPGGQPTGRGYAELTGYAGLVGESTSPDR